MECHVCGYDMRGRVAGEACPECGTAFDTRPDAPGCRTRSMTILITLVLSMVLMPFLMLLSILMLIVVAANEHGYRKSLKGCRVPRVVARRMRVCQWMQAGWIAEVVALMVVGWVWPQALNFW